MVACCRVGILVSYDVGRMAEGQIGCVLVDGKNIAVRGVFGSFQSRCWGRCSFSLTVRRKTVGRRSDIGSELVGPDDGGEGVVRETIADVFSDATGDLSASAAFGTIGRLRCRGVYY